MKKQLLLKTLLAAVLLCVGGSSAWAQIIYSWEGGDPTATQTGGTAAVIGSNDALNVTQSTVAGTLYVMQVASKQADVATSNITITLDDALQIGDIVRISGFQNKDASDKVVALYLGFKNGDTDKGNITETSSDNWVNLRSGYKTADAPETRVYSVTSALAGSNKILLARSQSGTNLWISKVEVIRPVVNADIDFSGTVTNHVLSGTTNTMTLADHEKNEIADQILTIGTGANIVTIPEAQRAGLKDKVVFTFEMSMGKWDKMYTGFRIKDASGSNIGYLRYGKYNGVCDTNLGITTSDFKEYNTPLWARRTYFTITIDYNAKKVYTETVWYDSDTQASDKKNSYSHEVTLTNTNPVATFEVFGEHGNSNAWDRRCKFDNLLIKTIVGDYSTAKTITYAYEDNNGADITALALANGGLSSAVGEMGETFTPTYPASFTDAEYANDYTYASGGDAFTVTGDATVTLVYTKSAHPTTNVTLQYKSGGVVKKEEVVAEGYPVGKPLSYGVHQYIMGNDGVFYQTSTGSNWYYRTANAAATIAENVTASGINNVVYFTEAEAVSGASSQDMTSRASNGKVGYTTNSDTYVNATTLTPGKYSIYMRTVTANTGGRTFNFKVGEDNVFSHYVNGSNTNNIQNSEEFTVSSSSTLSFAADGGNANGNGLDWFYVVKTAETKTITAAGWATYCSPYALDLDNATGLTDAYIITGGEGGTLAKTSMKGGTVPANTGLLIKGDEGTATIPVVASSSTSVSANKLVGVTANTNIAAEAGYVLMGSPSLGFYKNTNAFTVGAYTAYLPSDFTTDSARSFFSLFEDDATAIEAVKAQSVENGQFFNLAGQRVAQPTKGLYIVNGKKVVVK